LPHRARSCEVTKSCPMTEEPDLWMSAATAAVNFGRGGDGLPMGMRVVYELEDDSECREREVDLQSSCTVSRSLPVSRPACAPERRWERLATKLLLDGRLALARRLKLPSVGSFPHLCGRKCQPCRFHRTGRCYDGENCLRCHFLQDHIMDRKRHRPAPTVAKPAQCSSGFLKSISMIVDAASVMVTYRQHRPPAEATAAERKWGRMATKLALRGVVEVLRLRGIPSIGSVPHHCGGVCRPCRFNRTHRCFDGEYCKGCHGVGDHDTGD